MPENRMATLLRILKHRVTIALLVLLGLATALELAAPPAIRLFAIHWLNEHGVADAEIGSLRINPFSWSMVVHDLKAGPGLQAGRAAVNIDWWPFWHHQIYVWDVALDHARLELVQDKKGAWQIAGLTVPAAAPATGVPQGQETPWQVVLHKANMKDVRILLAGHDLKADVPIQSLDVSHSFLSKAGVQTLDTTLQLGPIKFSGFGYKADGAGLLLHGQIMLPGPGASPENAGARNVTIRLRALSLSAAKGMPSLTLGRARVSGIAVQGPDQIKLGDMKVDDVALRADVPGAADTSVGHIEARSLQYAKGNIDLDALQVKDIRATDASRKVNLGSVADISMAGLSVDHDRQGVLARLSVRGITLPATKEHAMGKIGEISATDAHLASSRVLQLSQLDIRGMAISLARDKHGMLVFNQLQASAPRPAPAPAPKAAKASATAPSPVNVQIGQFTIDKGSRIDFEDDTVNPPFQGTLKVESFRFAPLEIGGKQPGNVNAAFGIGGQGKLTVKGDMNLDRANPSARLAITLRRLSMPMLSGYLARSFGYTIGTGQMDLDDQLLIHDRAIDAKNKLVIRNLDLNATKQSGKATQSIGMPLDMAVSMLQDDRGDISLDVPVSGRLDDPNVNINDAINQALATAIKSGAMSYASLLLQPYGSILPALSLASGLIQSALRPRLTPIAFPPQTASLSDEAKAYVTKIALLLKKKPFRLQACGIASRTELEDKSSGATSGDEKIKNGRLLSLAKARSSAVVKALLADGISGDRVFECLPEIDAQPKGTGRVELLLN
jgi:Domain of Unknown Function (DUF748)